MRDVAFYRAEFNEYLEAALGKKEPAGLYDPVHYIMAMGGKRLRPVLTLMVADAFGGDYREALPAALAVEMFHNFSLVHDDIMDEAPLRRGKATVHQKWDLNTGILSGDAMLIKSGQYLEAYSGDLFKALISLFNITAIQVCEGQQYDIDFEQRQDVTIPEYLKMIEYKTAVLVAAAMKMGAMVAAAGQGQQDAIYEFGRNLGLAFQLQDDYLDAFGDPEKFGKQVGGDILENKKTYLYLKSLELATSDTAAALRSSFEEAAGDPVLKVDRVKAMMTESGGDKASRSEIEAYTEKAFQALEQTEMASENKEKLLKFAHQLMDRQS